MAACAMMATSADAMYIIGEPAGGWSPSVGIEMEETDGGWKWEGTIGSNDYFAFATELGDPNDWSSFNENYRLSPDAGDGALALNGEFGMHHGFPDCAFKGAGVPATYFVKEQNGSYVLSVTTQKMYILGAMTDPVWSPAVGIEMEVIDGGWQWSGELTDTEYFSFATQLVASDTEWNIFNEHYRLSPDGGDGTSATVGRHGMHFGDPACAFKGIGMPVTYLVGIENGKYYLQVINRSGSDEVWSVIGSFSNWEEDVDMAQTAPGVWSVTMDVLEGEFKFRKDHSWDVNYGAGELPTGDELDCAMPVILNGPDIYINPSFRVTLTLDLNNEMLYIYLPKPLGMRGSFNEWGWDEAYIFKQQTPGIFTLNMDTVKADWEFKVSNDDWSENYGADFAGMLADTTYSLVPNGANMSINQDYKNVVWVVNLLDNTIYFYGDVDTSVDELEVSDSAARYYNLQGVEVEKPVNGLYIRVANGKSEKVLVK